MKVVHISDIFSIITGEMLSKDGQFGVINLLTYMVRDRQVLMCELDGVINACKLHFMQNLPVLTSLWGIGKDHNMLARQFLGWFFQYHCDWYVTTPLSARVLDSLNLKENDS